MHEGEALPEADSENCESRGPRTRIPLGDWSTKAVSEGSWAGRSKSAHLQAGAAARRNAVNSSHGEYLQGSNRRARKLQKAAQMCRATLTN